FSRILPCEGVDRVAVYIQIIVWDYSRTAIYGAAAAVEDSSKHVCRDREFDGLAGESYPGLCDIEPGGSFEDLDDGDSRSEERRVGKECRSRWARETEKEN